MFKQTLAMLAIGMFAGTSAAVAVNLGATLSEDGYVTYVSPRPYANSVPPSIHPPSLRTIFSNLNPKYATGRYWCCAGLTVAGSNSGLKKIFADGVQFSLATDAKITEMDAAVGRIQGSTTVVFSIYTDRYGAPGKALGSFTVNNVVQYGACCVLAVGTGNPIRVRAGKLYWAVVSTTSPDSDTWASWSFNSVDELNGLVTTSTNAQGQWQPGVVFAPAPAFALYGK